uniref:Secreted protein n=1 Tax=Panagrellus redivivus TaxID=6233 RepID=A0A7E4VVP7_PANRE
MRISHGPTRRPMTFSMLPSAISTLTTADVDIPKSTLRYRQGIAVLCELLLQAVNFGHHHKAVQCLFTPFSPPIHLYTPFSRQMFVFSSWHSEANTPPWIRCPMRTSPGSTQTINFGPSSNRLFNAYSSPSRRRYSSASCFDSS